MKTTIDLPADLLIAAKQRAAEQRRSLKALITDALRAALEGRPCPPGEIEWVTVPGLLASDLDPSDREATYEWLAADGTRS